MFLALKEMARAKARFGLLIVAIGMLVFLILFQQSLQNGLLTSFVGAIRNQSAPVLVYSVDGQRVIQGSVITPDLEAQVGADANVGKVGRIGLGTFTAETTDGERFDTTVLGYESADLGAPSSLAKSKDVKLLAYAYPSMPFMQNPEWTAWRTSQGKRPEGYLTVDTGLRSYQDWFVNKLVSFCDATTCAGFSFDHWWIAYEEMARQCS